MRLAFIPHMTPSTNLRPVRSSGPVEALRPVSETERALSLQMALKCADLVSHEGVTAGRVRYHLQIPLDAARSRACRHFTTRRAT